MAKRCRASFWVMKCLNLTVMHVNVLKYTANILIYINVHISSYHILYYYIHIHICICIYYMHIIYRYILYNI